MKGIGLVLLLGACLITRGAQEATNTFRVMTYNIHHAEGPDGKVDLGRIASAIKAEKADIVALQEVDRGTLRTTRRDLTAELAKLTGMNSYFEKNIEHQGGEYGNAILTRFPILERTNTHYQMLQEHERRGLLSVVLEIDGRKVLFMNTHFDYHHDDAERSLNVKQIKERLDAEPNTAAILCGDFNGGPGSSVYKRLTELFIDSWQKAGQGKGHTFPSGTPTRRIDYIWISKGVTAKKMRVSKSEASDHLPLVGEFSLE